MNIRETAIVLVVKQYYCSPSHIILIFLIRPVSLTIFRLLCLTHCIVQKDIHYRSELWDHLFVDDYLNYFNFNSVSDEILTLNNVKAIKIIFKVVDPQKLDLRQK